MEFAPKNLQHQKIYHRPSVPARRISATPSSAAAMRDRTVLHKILLRPPRRPDWTPFMVETFSMRRYREWLPFLSMADAAYWNAELQP